MFGTSKKFALIAAVATLGIASPALAQSFDHTGTLFASHYDMTGKQTVGSWGPQAAAPQARLSQNERAVRGRGLYATTVAPYAAPVVPSVSGYDGSIESQR